MTALCMDKDPTEDLKTCFQSLFNVKKENETEARAAFDFWQNSWTAGKSESECEASEISTEVLQKNQKKKKKKTCKKGKSDATKAVIMEALSEIQKEAFAENMNERCKNLQFDEGLTNAAAEIGALHLDKFRSRV